jgi:hypothetical protein
MSKGLKHKPTKFSDDDMQVEFIGLIDESGDADANEERVRSKIANMIALGLKRGRPRREENDNEKIAA